MDKKLGVVFYVSVIITGLFVLWGFFAPAQLQNVTGDILNFITNTFGWFYLFATFMFLIFALYLAFGPYGRIKLGEDDEDPEYGYMSWLAMLFSAGMGIGLVFWGVGEPMYHFFTPPTADIEPESVEAASTALRYSFFHWGLHPWAIYTIVALSLAYFQFRKRESGVISSAFRPILGNRVDGSIGYTIDTLAVIATVFGVATSLGFGTLQIAGGLSYVLDIPSGIITQLMIILIVTILYMLSTLTGLNRGILYLSNVNLIVAGLLLFFVIFTGPTAFIIETFTTTIGSYLGELIPMSFRMTPFTGGEWIGAWTIFYWAWWIAWAPFVGSFIARVSRGRTIREFVSGVLLVPTLLGGLWFAAFGGSAIFFDLNEGANIGAAVHDDLDSSLFVLLEQFPFGAVLAVLAILLIITFFITSADSATFVLGMMTSKGALNPALSTRVVWGIIQSSIAAALLLSGHFSEEGDGLTGLQTASIIAALPFALVMLFMVVSVNRSLRQEVKAERRKEKRRIRKLEQLVEEEILNNEDDGSSPDTKR
ncbi:glycine betaine uptake BCCT transporter [Caldalkalibacillus salinus]|uniref:glycine betaine uptake BCCT transporter n=1 Tax=Caldalkalibacillus salinus TaxID=2803787 RepID=UPI0019237B5A|nr:BCCT family transporter [Caldalkalibacillus salinus]